MDNRFVADKLDQGAKIDWANATHEELCTYAATALKVSSSATLWARSDRVSKVVLFYTLIAAGVILMSHVYCFQPLVAAFVNVVIAALFALLFQLASQHHANLVRVAIHEHDRYLEKLAQKLARKNKETT